MGRVQLFKGKDAEVSRNEEEEEEGVKKKGREGGQ